MSIREATDTYNAFAEYANHYASGEGRAALRLAGACAGIVQQDTHDQVADDGDNGHELAAGARVRYALDAVSEAAPEAYPDRGESINGLRAFVDGDQIAIVGPDFVNLQESEVVAWVPAFPAPIPTTVAESLARVLARTYCDGSSVSHTSYPADEDQVNDEWRISQEKWLAIATAFLTGKAV